MRIFLSLLACFSIALINQNCAGQDNSYGNRELASVHTSTILDVDLPSSKARVGDRVFIATVFADVFLPQNGEALTKPQAVAKAGPSAGKLHDFITSDYSVSEDKVISDIISETVLKQNVEFHGLCSFSDRDTTCAKRNENSKRVEQAELSTIAPGSVTREGFRISTCKKVIEVDRAVENLILNISDKRNSIFKEEYIMEIYDLFYPGQKIDEDSYFALVDSFESAKKNGESNLDTWRTVIIPVCYSVGWQIP